MIFFGIIVYQDCVFELQKRVDSQMQNFPNTQFFLRPMYYSCYVAGGVFVHRSNGAYGFLRYAVMS